MIDIDMSTTFGHSSTRTKPDVSDDVSCIMSSVSGDTGKIDR